MWTLARGQIEGEEAYFFHLEKTNSLFKKEIGPLSHPIQTHISYQKAFNIYKINYTWFVNPQKI
jgi:hypothetical protein